ncbi:hypothetical protein JKP88DRAFT_251447 [Tribonema minus]|uniref:DUF221-domain-containing protein n=1 Tax=Tribonema minus TaxID=303371 RepID=A0A835ZHV1_9STRA|nr:hypothetical protein JKP88DRAFT_251447 [Tribonema minus]
MGWVKDANAVDDQQTVDMIGLDTMVFLRFLRMGFKITAISSIFALVVLLPVYGTGDNPDPAAAGYNRITMANITDGGSRLWASLIFWWIFVALVLYFFWKEWQAYIPLRRRFLMEGDSDTPDEYRYTVMVEGVPPEHRSSHVLRHFFERMFPSAVASAHLCVETEEIEKVIKEQHKARDNYEKAVARSACDNYEKAAECKARAVKLIFNPNPDTYINPTLNILEQPVGTPPGHDPNPNSDPISDSMEQHKVHDSKLAVATFSGGKKHKKKQVKVGGKMCCGGHKVDAMEHYEQRLPLLPRTNGTDAQRAAAVAAAPLPPRALHLQAEASRLAHEGELKRRDVTGFQQEMDARSDDALRRDARALSDSGGSGGGGGGGAGGKAEGGLKHVVSKVTGHIVIDVGSAGGKAKGGLKNVVGKVTGHDDDEEALPAREREFANRWQHVASSTGFVTLASLVAKQAAVQCDIAGRPGAYEVLPAPEPRDVIWENVTTPAAAQKKKKSICNAFWILGILFWAIPVAFTQAVANLQGLKQKLPWLWIPPTNSVLYGLISGYLPVILFLALMALIPVVITLSAKKFIKLKSQSAVDTYLFKWHFGFQLANLWLILIGGSIINQLSPMIADPTSTVTYVASAVPGASQFFLNIIITSIFLKLFLELSCIIGVVLNIFKRMIKKDECRSQRELDASRQPKSLVWGKIYPPVIFNLLVALVYICIVPIIQPFCALYFGLAYLIYKHQALHVYAQPTEGGGAYFPLLFTMMMGCLYTAEVVMIVYFGIKKGPAQTPLAFVPLIATFLFDRYVRKEYVHFTRMLALESAAEADVGLRTRGGEGGTSVGGEEVKEGWGTGTAVAPLHMVDSDYYVQPALRRSTWETDPLPYRTNANKKEGEGANDQTDTQAGRPVNTGAENMEAAQV